MGRPESQEIDRRKFLKLIALGVSASVLGALGMMSSSGPITNVAGAEPEQELEWPDACDPYLQ